MAVGRRGAAQRLTRTQRRTEALKLRTAGASLRDIATALRVGERTVRRDLDAALATLSTEQQRAAEALRALEAERLDRLQLGHWKRAIGGDVAAANVVLKIMERRARLLGLDAQPGATLDPNVVVILRWHDADRTIIDVTPNPGDHAAAAASLAADDRDAPGALPYRVRWATLGQEPAGGDAHPEDGAGARGALLVGGAELPPGDGGVA